MNTEQINNFGPIVETLTKEGWTNLRTEHEAESVRFYGEKETSSNEEFIAILLKNGCWQICSDVEIN